MTQAGGIFTSLAFARENSLFSSGLLFVISDEHHMREDEVHELVEQIDFEKSDL